MTAEPVRDPKVDWVAIEHLVDDAIRREAITTSRGAEILGIGLRTWRDRSREIRDEGNPLALPVPAPDALRAALRECWMELEREHGHSSAWPDDTWPSCLLTHQALRSALATLREGETPGHLLRLPENVDTLTDREYLRIEAYNDRIYRQIEAAALREGETK